MVYSRKRFSKADQTDEIDIWLLYITVILEVFCIFPFINIEYGISLSYAFYPIMHKKAHN